MKTINLDSAGKIQIKLAETATTQLDWTVSYYDVTISDGTVLEGSYTGTTNSVTAVDVVVAPASGHIRTLKSITVYNADNISHIIILQLVDAGGTRVIIRTTLTTLSSFSSDDMNTTVDITGKVTGPASATDFDVALFDGTSGKLIKDSGILLSSKAPLASPTFTGTVTLPTAQLGEASIKLYSTLTADGKWCGITQYGVGGETLVFGDLCYFKAADTKRWKVDGILDGTDTGFDKQLGMCVLAGASTATEILLYGKINAASVFPTLTAGAAVYAADTAGTIIVAQPSTTNFAIRKIGFALTADELMFCPSNDYIVHI